MKKIVVGFSKSNKRFAIGSWLIRLYQGTPFSHTYIKLLTFPNLPSDKVLHASEGLVQNMSYTQFQKKHRPTHEFEILILENWLYSHIVGRMHEQSGDNYSIMQNIGILYVDLMARLGFKKKNPFTKGWNCSEFVAFVLSVLYPDEINVYDSNTVTPKQLYDLLTKMSQDGTVAVKLTFSE